MRAADSLVRDLRKVTERAGVAAPEDEGVRS
jgi:hypothetical protein